MLCTAALTVVLSAPSVSRADGDKPLFPFVIPWSGTELKAGAVTDVSFLNSKPAGLHGAIRASGGHFVESGTGRRIRFLATNFAAKTAFPSHADAEKVALRLARLGINLVRMHHMDNDDWGQDASIWDYSFKDRQHISAAQLDKLDYLIAQLKKNGIYLNLNLHVSRQFTEADGFPESVSKIAFSYDKRVDEFDSRMIELQKRYVHDLLTHVNPYTGLAYCVDPAIAVVEINNENSLVGDPWANYGADLDTLPEPFRGELAGLWNRWLLRTYHTQAALKTAWAVGVTPNGPGLLSAGSTWSDEHQGGTESAMTVKHQENSAGAEPIEVEVRKTDGTDWHVQAHVTGLDLQDGSTYTVSFRAKASASRTIGITAGLDQADWHNIGLTGSMQLGEQWKQYRFVFDAHNVVAKHGRVALVVGGDTGTVSISDLQIHPGAEGAGIQPKESLEEANVGIPVNALRAEHADWIRFLADTERDYAVEMRRYLKDELKVQSNIICSQVSWGGKTGIRRESEMDFADNHAYWQHPSFPHQPWDSEDWFIDNTSMTAALGRGEGGTLAGLAEYRLAGKPYTVSEYNHPAPNEYRTECVPIFADFAAMQDWDAIYLFDYGEYGTGAENDKINGYFGISSDPAKTAFLPAAALMFRSAEIPALAPGTVTVASRSLDEANGSVWPAGSGARLFNRAMQVKVTAGLEAGPPTSQSDSRMARLPGAHLDMSGGKAVYVSESPSAVCITGFVGGRDLELKISDCRMKFPQFGNGFASITLTSMDLSPINSSKRLLLTIASTVENLGMQWNAQRTSIGSHWGTGPTQASGVPLQLEIHGAKSIRHAWALDGSGNRAVSVPVQVNGDTVSIKTGPEYRTLWYELGD